MSIEDSINVPTLITFQLSNIDQLFVVPRRSSYVTIQSEIYAPGGGYGSGKILATGFVTTEPERTFLGLSQGKKATNSSFNTPGSFQNQVYTYSINVTSDEWLLNVQPIPYIPAFVNQTDSQILAAIANVLSPGVFNTSAMASGNIVPYYQYDPAQTWSDVAKTFADANRYHYKVVNKVITYQPFGDKPLGISYDDTTQKENAISPLEMKTSVVTVPPVNDCIVIGDTEPQTNWDNYFVGDGFTSNFQLKHQVFQGTTSQLLSDDWTESSFTQGTWTVNDPFGQCVLADANGNAVGALNIIQKGQLGTYSPQDAATYIQAQNGLELGGGINLQHGQVVFNDTASGGGGIIGGVYGVSAFTPGNCLAGFGITGQNQAGPFSVSGVEILDGNTSLVNLYVFVPQGSSLGSIQPGYVLQCSGFQGASFLDNTRQVVQSVTLVANSAYGPIYNANWVAHLPIGYTLPNGSIYKLTCQGLRIWSSPYPFAVDSGSVQANINDVLVTASGAAGIVIQPILNGKYVGQPIVSQINHQYVLQTWIGANTQTRYTRKYGNLTQTQFYGGQNLAASGAVSFIVTDINLGDYVIEEQNPLFGLFPSAPAPVVTKFMQSGVTLPPFALYCLINGIDLNVSINYTVLSEPPQGYLTVQSLTGMSGGNLPWKPEQLSPPITYQLGFGMINQTAQIAESGELFSLSFYTDDIPSVGSRIRFLSWSAGQSIARVRDPIAIANEASISGDNGVRSAIMTNLSPLPRSSDECEAAAAASILDREYPQFQGSYTVVTVPFKYENLYSAALYDYPKSGEFFYVNSLVRGITGQNFFVNTARIQVVELKQEVLNISIDYGPDLYLEKLLPAFLENEQNILVPKQTVPPPNYITLGQVLNAHLPTLDNAQVTAIVNSLTGNYIVVDLGAEPVTGCEVRNVDSGWGVANQGRIGLFTTQVFTLPRTVRDQTWYLRTLNGNVYSRFSKALRVVYPLVPSAPTLVSADTTKAVFDYAGDVRDIYGLELRALPLSGVLFFVGTSTEEDDIAQFVRSAISVGTVPQSNVVAVYDPPNASPPSTQLNVGDIVYTACPSDKSFQNIEIVSQVVQGVSPLSSIPASGVCLVAATAYFYWNNNSDHGFQRTYPVPIVIKSGSYANPQAVVPINSLQWNSPNVGKGVDPTVQPMVNDIYDVNGNYHGYAPTPPATIPPQGLLSGLSPIGTAGYDMIVSGALFIPKPGTYTFQIACDDCYLIGIQGGTYVAGSNVNPNGQTTTAMNNYPILGAYNKTGYNVNTLTVSFAASGVHQFEIDYTQWTHAQSLCITVTIAPAGAYGATAPILDSLGGRIILPAPAGAGFQGAQGTPTEFGWFDYDETYPDNQGVYNYGVSNPIGTVQQIQTGSYSFVSSGAISGNNTGVCTIYTQTPHGLTPGSTAIIGCGWGTWPGNLPLPPQTGSVFCGQYVVTNVLSITGFQFVISRFQDPSLLTIGWEQAIAASGVNAQLIQGVCALMPTPSNTNNLLLASGLLLQRAIFAPSDLVVDFTQPDIAEALELLQALSPNNRVGGINAYFFNSTWDYSAPTAITSFTVPQLINIVIDATTQQVEWQVQQGKPLGYRVEITDPVTGITYNRFTVDHPNNTQNLKQFKINPLDFASTRNITITPFDALGDGVPTTIINVTANSITGSQSPGTYSIGSMLNGSLPPNTVLMRIPFDIPVQFATNFPLSQAWLETPPASTPVTITIYKIPQGGTVANEFVVGSFTFAVGSCVATFSSGDIVNFNAGDIIRVVTPASVDSATSDIGFVLSGIKN